MKAIRNARERRHQERWETWKASLRAKVEHPFRVIKRQFGYTKVRYRGLAKNTAQVLTLFALSNLWMARRELMPAQG
ncbi:IS5 family transposase [Xanthomonas arboricola]|nr:IS5 family transposase [Xanthomonas arboricola]